MKKELNYDEFIETKKKRYVFSGFEIDQSELNPILFPFQKFCVQLALKAGKYALFEDCGLGKTFQQLEWAHQVSTKEQRPVLILCPLAVAGQTIQEGIKMGLAVSKLPGKVEDGYGLYITNYEQITNLDPAQFAGVVLDESSILKSFDGKMRNLIMESFSDTPYKLACTATPSPNDPMELGNHAEFLGVMKYQEMLAMYFVHDASDTSKWRLKGHAKSGFYSWIATWAVMMANPADIGFEMDGYNLPPLNIEEIEIKTPKRDNGLLFNDTAVSATNHNQELRITIIPRLEAVADLVNGSDENWIVWVKQNAEDEKVMKMLPDAVSVKGSDKPEDKESRLLGFANGDFRVLVTKTKIAQFGMNFQNCRNQVFAAPDFSFEGLYQAIRRSYRFGQKNEVNIYLVTTDTMQNIGESLRRKQAQFEAMQQLMADAFTNSLKIKTTKKTFDVERIETENYTAVQGDCVQLIQELPDQSIGFSVFSPPFADLYTYSDELEDMGNCSDYDEFVIQFGFLVKELARVMKPGRNVAVHCMDVPIQKGKEGYIGLRDFSGMILQAFQKNGFIYHSRVTIWKNPVTEMQRTKALGLLHKQLKKDSSMSRVGIPDYLMVFRNAGENVEPIRCDLTVDRWQEYASPVWMDIDYGNTLNKTQARDENDEKHICPLQLDTIKRAVKLWTNEGDTVLTPFGGIGSEAYQAIKMGRKAIAFELKPSYFQEMKKNLRAAELENAQLSII